MTRLPDWPARLSELVVRAHTQPFRWGIQDCCLWAADAVQALTGHDPAADLRGRYADAKGALCALQAQGGLMGAGQRAGVLLAAPAYARDGDIALVHDGRRPMLAVQAGGVWLVAATNGLHALPAGAARMAWGVGHA